MIPKFLRKIKSLWSKEWVVKLISLFLAVLLWYFVGGEDVVDKNVMVPVEVINMPKDLIISNKYKKEIAVTVRGPRSIIMEMDKRQDPRQIDLSAATPGTKVERIENESIPVSRGIEVLRVQPSTIILSLDKLIQKELPINPVTIGNVTPGYVLKELTLDPNTITITGPQTVLSQTDILKTTPINIQGISESTQQQIPIDLDQAMIDLIGETSVTADITIGFDTIEKTIENVPVSVVDDGYVQKVDPPVVTVTMKIPKMIIQKNIDFGSLFAITAVPGQNSGNILKVQVIPSEKLTVPLEIITIEPEFVTLVNPPPKPVKKPDAPAKIIKSIPDTLRVEE